MIGQKLLHYEIVAKPGERGMGAVYRARDTHLGRDVAIKILPADAIADPERRAQQAAVPGMHTDIATLAAIAVTVYGLANLLHVGLGHGGACAAVGATLQVISSLNCECETRGIGPASNRLIAAGGTLVNIAGAA